jgi:hypothetical protein
MVGESWLIVVLSPHSSSTITSFSRGSLSHHSFLCLMTSEETCAKPQQRTDGCCSFSPLGKMLLVLWCLTFIFSITAKRRHSRAAVHSEHFLVSISMYLFSDHLGGRLDCRLDPLDDGREHRLLQLGHPISTWGSLDCNGWMENPGSRCPGTWAIECLNAMEGSHRHWYPGVAMHVQCMCRDYVTPSMNVNLRVNEGQVESLWIISKNPSRNTSYF